METNEPANELNDAARQVLLVENTFYQEVTITGVNGACPYGHRPGDQFKITAMNSDGICGSLLKSIMFPVTTLHYGGGVLWENDPDVSRGWCPEGGTVQVEIRPTFRPAFFAAAENFVTPSSAAAASLTADRKNGQKLRQPKGRF